MQKPKRATVSKRDFKTGKGYHWILKTYVDWTTLAYNVVISDKDVAFFVRGVWRKPFGVEFFLCFFPIFGSFLLGRGLGRLLHTEGEVDIQVGASKSG
jgi:hypothetical protein